MSATGNNNEDFLPRNWDVSEYKGKKAYLEIVDAVDGDWGHISVDNIEFSNSPVDAPTITIDKSHAYFGNLALSVFDGNATGTADDSEIIWNMQKQNSVKIEWSIDFIHDSTTGRIQRSYLRTFLVFPQPSSELQRI